MSEQHIILHAIAQTQHFAHIGHPETCPLGSTANRRDTLGVNKQSANKVSDVAQWGFYERDNVTHGIPL